jgi:hypothetical protein
MEAIDRYTSHDDRPREDHVVLLSDITWEEIERLLAMRGDHSAPRIAYLEGAVEIMSPSQTKEVWYWRKGRIQPYCLRGERYEPVSASKVLPGLDLDLQTRFIGAPTTSAAIRGFRAALHE